MGWESATTVVVTGVAVGGLITLQIRSLDGRMSSLESRVSGIEQRLARIEGLLEGYFASSRAPDANTPTKSG